MDSPEIQRAKEIGWKESHADLMDGGSHPGYESPDGRWFLSRGQLEHQMKCCE